MPIEASVIIRAKDKEATIGATLTALRGQTHAAEIIVIDSGSTDATVEIAKRWADSVIEIAPSEFSYGGALNLGASVASGRIHFALSAHCVPERDDWVEQSIRLYADSRVAGTNHALHTPWGEPIKDHYLQTPQDALRRPEWGFSNHASSWRSDVWKDIRFREDLPACEDKEWSWRVLAAGWHIAYSPHLPTPSTHRRKQGIRGLHQRVARESMTMVSLGATRQLTVREAVSTGWGVFSPSSRWPNWLRRLSPYRVVELSGAVVGSREGIRHPVAPALEFFNDGSPDWRAHRPPYDPVS